MTTASSPKPSSTKHWDAVSVIIAKRDGEVLPDDAIRWFINAYTEGTVADEQASALAMAVFLNGLTPPELATWTEAMIDTGDRVDHSALGRITVDKHSTGGVGDKVSLILCPLVAACSRELAVPQLAGRGLGHTGGTIDKMESIPGWRPELTAAEMKAMLLDVGAMIASASGNIAPADKKLYALRDTTGTVASIPLIASSIMSKKIAGGTQNLVLDVKIGRGAFMTNVGQARELAETMVGIGQRAGVKTVALLTRMDQPLGSMIGNTVEVNESIELLEGGDIAPRSQDLADVTLALAVEMLDMAGIDADPAAVLASGAALPVWEGMVAAQGGDLSAPRPVAAHEQIVEAPSDGYLADYRALDFGIAAVRLGAGRARKGDDISFGAGIELLVKPGSPVSAGQPILRLMSDDASTFEAAADVLADATTIAPEPSEIPDPVIERIS